METTRARCLRSNRSSGASPMTRPALVGGVAGLRRCRGHDPQKPPPGEYTQRMTRPVDRSGAPSPRRRVRSLVVGMRPTRPPIDCKVPCSQSKLRYRQHVSRRERHRTAAAHLEGTDGGGAVAGRAAEIPLDPTPRRLVSPKARHEVVGQGVGHGLPYGGARIGQNKGIARLTRQTVHRRHGVSILRSLENRLMCASAPPGRGRGRPTVSVSTKSRSET